MKQIIVADSSSNLYSLKDAAYASVPLKIVTDAAEYIDNADLDVKQMVAELKSYSGRSGTSCPNISDWLTAMDGADEAFLVTITSNLSAAYASAMQAKAEFEAENPNGKVAVFDTLSTGPEMELVVEKLRDLMQEGKSFTEIEASVRRYMEHTHLLFCLESLDNLAKNGRVNGALAKLVGVLGIRIVGKASDVGTLEQLHKTRGEKRALPALYQEMLDNGFNGGKVRIAHCMNPSAAQKLADMIKAEYPKTDIFIRETGALCAFYAEEGGLLVGYEDKEV